MGLNSPGSHKLGIVLTTFSWHDSPPARLYPDFGGWKAAQPLLCDTIECRKPLLHTVSLAIPASD